MTNNFESILDECISALQAGVPLEEILAEVPDYADELRPLLYASLLLADPNPALAPAQKKAELRAEYIKQMAELPARSGPTFGQKFQAVLHIVRRRLTRQAILSDLITISITVILTLGMLALLLTILAEDTIPGDLLYGTKRISERVGLAITFDDRRKTEFLAELNERRIWEIEQLIAQDRAAVVEFRGVVEVMGENLWVIEGYPVKITDEVIPPLEVQLGDTVEVVGFLGTNNVLVADTLRAVSP